MIRAVVFDLDGTLYDYGVCDRKAEAALLNSLSDDAGISIGDAKQRLYDAKKSVKNQLGNVAASHNRLLYAQALCEGLGLDPLLHAIRLYNVYWNTFLDEMRLYPYVAPLLGVLAGRGVKVGILTNLTAHIQYRKVEKLGLVSRIDYFTTSEEAGEEKPSAKIFQKMLSKIPFERGEILMIGDDAEQDVKGAMNIGMKAILWSGGGVDIIRKVEALL